MYPLRFPLIFNYFFPSVILNKKNTEQKVYLTFDDGPTPEVTTFVLQALKKYQAKASFFCIGDKITRYPELFNKIIGEGHLVANHTYHHVDAWKVSTQEYLKDAIETEAAINMYGVSNKLFRPPFGHITPWHLSVLKKRGFQVVLWTSVAGDFKQNLDTDKVIKKLSRQTKPGDIIVFHDSKKAEKNLRKILPEVLKNLHQKGFVFDIL